LDGKLRTAGEHLIGFLDESGHSSATEFFALAAFVAKDADWATFDRLWRDALRDSGAPYLHMREFAHRVGVFRGWTEDQRRALLARCVNAVNSIPAVAVGAAMSMGDFDALSCKERSLLRDPFFCCFQEVVRGVTLNACLAPAGGCIRTVFSRQDEFGASARQLWDVMAETLDVRDHMGSLEFENMREVPALQAADLLAYELRHHYHLRKVKPMSAPRWAFREIVRHQHLAHNARMLKYLPAWYLKAQAGGTVDQLMGTMLSDPSKYHQRWNEMTPQVT
jgi:hypothetical protein